MRSIIGSILFISALSSAIGCSVAYTSIREQEDGSYILTESRSRAFKVQGQVYRCIAAGEKLTCQLIARPRAK